MSEGSCRSTVLSGGDTVFSSSNPISEIEVRLTFMKRILSKKVAVSAGLHFWNRGRTDSQRKHT